MNSKKYLSIIAVLGTVTSLAIALPALAADTNGGGNQPNPSFQGQMRSGGKASPFGKGQMRPSVFGTVASVSGNTITVTSMMGKRDVGSTTPPTTATTYSVDATNAVVTKNNATSSVSAIAVGDILMVQGAITGTNVVATKINDSIMRPKGVPGQNGDQNTSAILGNGQPVVAGTISNITGSTLTITNKSNVSYSVDATNAKIVQGQTISTISNLAVGDSVVVQGTINGTSITASTVIDQKVTSSNTESNKNNGGGFLGGIGSFFKHLFGF